MPVVPFGDRVLYKEIGAGKQRRDKLKVKTAKEFGLGIAEAPTSILLAPATELLGRSLSGGGTMVPDGTLS